MYIEERMVIVNNEVLLGVLDFNEAKRMRSILEDEGVRLRLQSNPETCATGGCKVTVEVYASEIDVPKVREFFLREKERALDGLEVDRSLANEVFDPEKSEARCPACGTQFSTLHRECPDCGLVFITDNPDGE